MYGLWGGGGGYGFLAGLALMGALGGGRVDPARFTVDEWEDRCVRRAIERRRSNERDAARAIQELARALGPVGHHYGYGQHEATKGRKTQSASLQRMLARRK